MNAGPISNGVSPGHGDAYRAGLEDTDLLADVESHDHGSPGSGRSAVDHDLHVHTPSSRLYQELASVTQTILTKTAALAVFPCYNTMAVKGYDRRSGWSEPGKSFRGGGNQ